MKSLLEKLWNDYLVDECAILKTAEEKELAAKAAALHEQANAMLAEGQRAAVEQYLDALCDLDAIFARKAFVRGCEFAVAFLREAERQA